MMTSYRSFLKHGFGPRFALHSMQNFNIVLIWYTSETVEPKLFAKKIFAPPSALPQQLQHSLKTKLWSYNLSDSRSSSKQTTFENTDNFLIFSAITFAPVKIFLQRGYPKIRQNHLHARRKDCSDRVTKPSTISIPTYFKIISNLS